MYTFSLVWHVWLEFYACQRNNFLSPVYRCVKKHSTAGKLSVYLVVESWLWYRHPMFTVYLWPRMATCLTFKLIKWSYRCRDGKWHNLFMNWNKDDNISWVVIDVHCMLHFCLNITSVTLSGFVNQGFKPWISDGSWIRLTCLNARVKWSRITFLPRQAPISEFSESMERNRNVTHFLFCIPLEVSSFYLCSPEYISFPSRLFFLVIVLCQRAD